METFYGPSPNFATARHSLHDDLGKRLEKHYAFPQHTGYDPSSVSNSIRFYRSGWASTKIAEHLHKKYAEENNVPFVPRDKSLRDDRPYVVGPEHPDFHKHIANLDKATSMYHAPESFHAYSGLHSSPYPEHTDGPQLGIKTTHVGKDHIKAVLPAFTSTTIKPSVANEFATAHGAGESGVSHILKVHIEKGSKHGAFASHIGDKNPYENEFILGRGKKLHIHPEPEVQEGTHGNKYHIWHAKIVE